MADRFVINGESYEVPDSFTLKDLRIIERYTGGHAADDGYSISKLSGVIHVAIARAKPGVPFDEIQAVVDEIDPDELSDLDGGQSPPAGKTSEDAGSLTGDSGPSSDAAQENGTPSGSGSQDSATGFTSFHGISTTSPRRS